MLSHRKEGDAICLNLAPFYRRICVTRSRRQRWHYCVTRNARAEGENEVTFKVKVASQECDTTLCTTASHIDANVVLISAKVTSDAKVLLNPSTPMDPQGDTNDEYKHL